MALSLSDVRDLASAGGLSVEEQEDLLLYANSNLMLLEALNSSNVLRVLQRGLQQAQAAARQGGQSAAYPQLYKPASGHLHQLL